nr:uncharacterized protein LOC117992744 [Maniola hyperantus]
MSDAKLRELMVKRSSIKGRLTKFKNFLTHHESLKSVDEIEQTRLNIQLGKIDSLSTTFEEIQSQIEVLNSAEIDQELEERDSIELEFASLIATAQQFQNKYNQASNPNVQLDGSSHCCHEQPGIGFRPPTLQIGKFDGSYSKWLEFRDLYCSLVHNNKRIPTPIKFCYLNSYLEGEASRVISNLEVTDANYDKAWDLLCERYDNKRLLIKGHLNSLLSFDIKPSDTDKVLRSIVDNINKNLRALSSLGEATSHWDTLIIHIVSSKLASQTSMKWEEYRNSIKDTPTLEQFNKFLKDRADILETYNHPRSTSNSNSESGNNSRKKRPQTNVFATRLSQHPETVKAHAPLCEVCKGVHRIYDCEDFKNKTVEQRLALVNSLKLCRNCLRGGHSAYFCRAGSCRTCRKRHNSLICSNSQQLSPQDSAATATRTASPPAVDLTVNLARDNVKRITLLSTALVEAVNPVNKRTEVVRILLDCGAESSLISKGLQDRLELQSSPMEPVNLIGIGNLTSHCTNELCSFQLKSLHSDYVAELTCPVLPELTGDIPRLSINTNNLKFPTDVQLADPSFYEPSPIDVLVGADLFWHIVGCERQSLGTNKPYLINSEFGWILSGPINSGTRPSNIRCNFQVSSPQSDNLDKLLNRFWELEELSPKKLLSEDEKICEEHFQAHTTRDSSGRFCVRLPLKDIPDCLGNSYITAKKRFFNLEKRFKAQPELKSQYTEFINEYLNLGHCSILNVARLEPSYFLCHHAVFKQQSESTKLRVVFDASCPTSSGFSVNDLQYVGPTVQDTLFSILLRFRQHRYVLTGDIEKMFRQVIVHEDDRNLQLILWRDNEHSPLQTLRLNTITYGFASASYLSTKCLWRLGEECEDDLIKTIIQRDFYMDDLLTGADTISDLHHILATVVSVLRSGCFPLRKFKSNVPSIFESAVIDPLENLTLSESTSTLGLQWKPSTDTLNIVVSIPDHADDYITKRLILSHSFKIFDPLGLISPCTIRSKILMQELWRRNIDWDEPVPCDLQETWDDLKQDLNKLELIEIPRLALCCLPVTLELHSFCDASALAHGCCLYLRSVDSDGQVVVRLLCAKSRVNPSKPTTIPRLELLGALLAARLCKAALESLRCTISRSVHWSDSSVVLGWLHTNPSKLKTFVANRVVEICETTTPTNWRHVPTNYNPADLISRGTKAGSLLNSQLWWSGPKFLTESESEWPVLGEQIEAPIILE